MVRRVIPGSAPGAIGTQGFLSVPAITSSA
jgi:hypothetical protein